MINLSRSDFTNRCHCIITHVEVREISCCLLLISCVPKRFERSNGRRLFLQACSRPRYHQRSLDDSLSCLGLCNTGSLNLTRRWCVIMWYLAVGVDSGSPLLCAYITFQLAKIIARVVIAYAEAAFGLTRFCNAIWIELIDCRQAHGVR